MQQRNRLQRLTRLQRDQAKNSLDTVFKVIPDLFFRLSEDGVILDYIAQAEAILYAPPEEFLGKRMRDVLPSEVGQFFTAKLEQAITTERMVEFEYDLTLGGERKHYEARLSKLVDTSEVIVVVRDITVINQAQKSIGRYKLLLDDSLSEVYIFDAKTLRFTDVNRGARENLGYSIEELRKMTP